VLVVAASAGALVGWLVTGHDRTADWFAAAAVQLPAALVLGGVAVAAIGWVPRRSVAVAWAAMLGSLVVGQFGALLELPDVVMDLDPFRHVPAVPAEPMEVVPVVVLLTVAAALLAAGFLGWRRRDLET
jgi:ABC-2 type transport system permease protein